MIMLTLNIAQSEEDSLMVEEPFKTAARPFEAASNQV